MPAAGELRCVDSCERGAWKQRDIPGPAWGARAGEAQLAEAKRQLVAQLAEANGS